MTILGQQIIEEPIQKESRITRSTKRAQDRRRSKRLKAVHAKKVDVPNKKRAGHTNLTPALPKTPETPTVNVRVIQHSGTILAHGKEHGKERSIPFRAIELLAA